MSHTQYFQTKLKEGKAWETMLVPWLKNHFGDRWQVVDTTDVWRDADNDQFPDFTLISSTTGRRSYLDAKKRIMYRHRGHPPSFGIDRRLYISYTNIARKHATKCYVSFYDVSWDPDHWYLLDMDTKEDFIFDYGNNRYGEPISYRWYVDNLKKFKL